MKLYDKRTILPRDEKRVRRALALTSNLEHPGLVKTMGHWETDETIYKVGPVVDCAAARVPLAAHPALHPAAPHPTSSEALSGDRSLLICRFPPISDAPPPLPFLMSALNPHPQRPSALSRLAYASVTHLH